MSTLAELNAGLGYYEQFEAVSPNYANLAAETRARIAALIGAGGTDEATAGTGKEVFTTAGVIMTPTPLALDILSGKGNTVILSEVNTNILLGGAALAIMMFRRRR